jgi:NAD(P)-dependent dehydrogenase (short-subunit alcohol dehydrogenase family)
VNQDRLFDVAGRVVVVTGGLGRLGHRFATALAERGARVALLDLPRVVEGAAPRLGRGDASPNLRAFPADVTSRASLEQALEQISNTWDAPFGLINCAALDSPPDAPAEENGPFESYPASSWEAVMDVNVTGTMLACQVFGGEMARRGSGSIVNIGSIYGLVSPDQRIYEYRRASGEDFFKPVSYSASKSALLNLTRYLAAYWGDRGVRVNTLTLGGVFDGQDDRFLSGYAARAPLGRMARAGEYDGAVVFLMSDASSYMTGANLVLDGGWTAW